MIKITGYNLTESEHEDIGEFANEDEVRVELAKHGLEPEDITKLLAEGLLLYSGLIEYEYRVNES